MDWNGQKAGQDLENQKKEIGLQVLIDAFLLHRNSCTYVYRNHDIFKS